MTWRMTYRIFIDGAAGTTGLQVADRLARHPAVSVLHLDDESRKDNDARRDMMATADLGILCLPDDAAREAAAMAADLGTRLIDASTAHRTHSDWIYGFSELAGGQRTAIANAARISNPGCYPTGFLALARPLVDAGLLPVDAALCVPAVSGYSGGGKAMIARHDAGDLPAHGAYGVSLAHKHVPEMMMHSGLQHAPIFMPSVGAFYAGMLVHLPLQATQLTKRVNGQDLHMVLASHFADAAFVRMGADAAGDERVLDGNLLAADSLAGTNHMELFVFSKADNSQFWLVARLDNLGKGASGAAVQNMNIALGLAETEGLV